MPTSATATKKLGRISVVFDIRLSRQKSAQLTQVLNQLRQFADVKLLSGTLDESQVLAHLETEAPHLILLPWYRYFSWSKVEAFYGLTRTSGPTVAGYHLGEIVAADLAPANHLRSIMLDLGGPPNHELGRVIRSLLVENLRSGIRPLLGSAQATAIYCEAWREGQGLGHRMDTVLGLPEIGKTAWHERASALRLTLGALWSLVYEHGPGKTEFAQSLTASQPKAWFQVAASPGCMALRLCYSMSTWSPKDALEFFWPDPKTPSRAPQLLLRYADFLRVHFVTETNLVEVVAGFFKNAPAERTPDHLQTVWIEPISPLLVTEEPYERFSAQKPWLKPLPSTGPMRPEEEAIAQREKITENLLIQVKELRRVVREKDVFIDELRSGGIGASLPLPPPDADSLLDAFQEHFLDLGFRIREIDQKIQQMRTQRRDPGVLPQQLKLLIEREAGWVRRIADLLRTYADERRKAQKAA